MKRVYWILPLTMLLVIISMAVISPGGKSAESEEPHIDKRALTDPKDPTPSTPGRMTAEEEDDFRGCYNQYAGIMDITAYPEQAGQIVAQKTSECMESEGHSVESIKARNLQQKQDGYWK